MVLGTLVLGDNVTYYKMIDLNHFLTVKRLPVNNLTVLSTTTFIREAEVSNLDVDISTFTSFSAEKCSPIKVLTNILRF